MNVLVVNAGSSSLKYQLFDTDADKVLAKGICERIGTQTPNGIGAEGRIEHRKGDSPKIVKDIPMENHAVATKILVDTLTDPRYKGHERDRGCRSPHSPRRSLFL